MPNYDAHIQAFQDDLTERASLDRIHQAKSRWIEYLQSSAELELRLNKIAITQAVLLSKWHAVLFMTEKPTPKTFDFRAKASWIPTCYRSLSTARSIAACVCLPEFPSRPLRHCCLSLTDLKYLLALSGTLYNLRA